MKPAIPELLKKQKDFFKTGKTLDYSFRKEKLIELKKTIQFHEEIILEALKKDLGKSYFEGFASEIGFLYEEINFTIKHLKKWLKPKKVKTPMVNQLARSFILYEPYGTVLIISPWNYPFQLALAPLIGAIAAGNCAIIKPSEYSSHTSTVISRIMAAAFRPDFIAVVEGGVQETTELLNAETDYIFFTGSTAVGKVVMQAAAKNLIPVTLELGGKSPCIVDESADISLAAKRIAWGKFFNAGQTCIAPDYILVQSCVKADLISALKKNIQDFYGNNPRQSQEYGKIIHEKHFQRLKNLMNQGKIISGGSTDANSLFIEPTLIENLTWDDPVMQEEIFGPVLPVMEFHTLDEVIDLLREKGKPLALYLFSRNKMNIDLVLKRLSFGGGAVNDTLSHIVSPHMPFGGVGSSGIGLYHGKYSFETFSHQKSVLVKSGWLDLPFRYPPYTEKKLRLLKKFMK